MMRDTMTLIAAILLSYVLATRVLRDSQDVPVMTSPPKPPVELTDHPIGANGQKACGLLRGLSCSICNPPKPLPWQSTPKDIDNWTGNPWAKGLR